MSRVKRGSPARHIPLFPLITLGMVLVSLLGSVLLVKQKASYLSRAAQEQQPIEIVLSNLSENSLSVSWFTEIPLAGAVVYSGSLDFNQAVNASDDRGGETVSQFHHVTLKDLEPGTKYYFKVISGGYVYENRGRPFFFRTPQHFSQTPPPPSYLKGQAGGESLVYFHYNGSTTVSAVADAAGRFVLSTGNVLRNDLTDRYSFQPREKGHLFFRDRSGTCEQELVVSEGEVVSRTCGETPPTTQPSSPARETLPASVSGRVSWLSLVVEFINNLLDGE